MYFFIEACVLLLLIILYWHRGEHRRYYLERIGRSSQINLWNIARNFAYMLSRRPVRLDGKVSRIQPGCILYSIHYGIWELMPDPLLRRGYRVGVIVNRYQQESKNLLAYLSDRFLSWYRTRKGVQVFDKQDSMRIVRFLKRGGVLGVLVDGNRFLSKFDKIKKLSELCHVPMVPFAAYRSNGSGIIDIGCDLVHLVQHKPFDYLWFYRSRTA